MKELNQINQDKLEVRQEAPKEKKKILAARITPGDSHKVYELNLRTFEINKVELPKTAHFLGSKKTNISLTAKPDHIYCSALNCKNAERKFLKWLKQFQPQNA